MKITHILYSLCVVAVCSACSDYLDIKPHGRTVPKTSEEFAALLHTHLNRIDLGEDPYLVGNTGRWLLLDATCGDDFETCLTEGTGRSLGAYVGDAITASADTYRNLYAIIRDCNIVINEMKETGEQADQLRSVAHAIRGASYYQLMRFFCEVPSKQPRNQPGLPLVMTFDPEERPLRSDLQATIDFIESDFVKALQHPTTNAIYRFNEDVIKGYRTRFYFWTKQWDAALTLAQELLQKHPLLQGDAYKKMMTSPHELTGNQLLKAYRIINSSSGEGLSDSQQTISSRPVSARFLEAFSSTEKEKDIRYTLWVNSKRRSIKTFFCGMRAAEFKLIQAECLYHLGKQNEALQAINDLRAHRIDGHTPYTLANLPAPSSKEIIKTDAQGVALTPLLALILQERRKELFLEGDRFFEQKRNGAPEYWTAFNGLKYVTRSYMYTFPIPLRDIELVGQGLKQNPGYTETESN